MSERGVWWTGGNLRYSMCAAFDAGQTRHPQVVMRELGIEWGAAEPQPIADQWKFMGCRPINGEGITLPRYIDPAWNG